MGMTVSIYRDTYDSKMNDFYGKAGLTVINVDGPFEPTEDRPAAMLIAGPSAGGRSNPIIVPVEEDAEGNLVPVASSGPRGPRMMGGTYAATSDSRWSRAVEALGGGYGAVPVHDRIESWKTYEMMSR